MEGGIDAETFEDVFAPRRPLEMETKRPRPNRNKQEKRHSETRQERAERVVTEFMETVLNKAGPEKTEERNTQQKLYIDWVSDCLQEQRDEKDPYFFTGNDLEVSGDNLEDRQATVIHLPTLIQVSCSSEPDGHKNVIEAKNVLHDFLAQHIKEWSKTSPNFRERFGIPTHFNDLDH